MKPPQLAETDRPLPTMERPALNGNPMRQMLDLLPIMAWSSLPGGPADFFNQQWRAYTGVSHGHSEGWGWICAVHPDDVQRTLRDWCGVLLSDGNAVGSIEVRLRRADGEYRWFWLQATALLDATGAVDRWYVTTSDIHDRKVAEEGARRSQALLAEAKRLAGLGIFSFRAGTDTMDWCNALYRMFEFPLGTPVTRDLVEQRRHPQDSSAGFGQVFDGGNARHFEEQMRLLMPDGSTKHIQYCAYANTLLTGETEYIGSVQDITERHLAAEALSRARNELVQAANASSLGVLAASIAHEVSQPLSGIVMNANSCLRMLGSPSPDVPGAIEAAQRTLRDSNRTADVVSRLRTLFSHRKICRDTWDLASALEEIIDLAWGDLQRHRIALKLNYPAEQRLVLGDRIQIQQVMQNILRNAIDVLTLTDEAARQVTVDIDYQGGMARLRVSDTGAGFGKLNPECAFKMFFTTKKDGMGVGLPISRWIVEAHGGQLSAQSNPQGGACFMFTVPCAQPDISVDLANRQKPTP